MVHYMEYDAILPNKVKIINSIIDFIEKVKLLPKGTEYLIYGEDLGMARSGLEGVSIAIIRDNGTDSSTISMILIELLELLYGSHTYVYVHNLTSLNENNYIDKEFVTDILSEDTKGYLIVKVGDKNWEIIYIFQFIEFFQGYNFVIENLKKI